MREPVSITDLLRRVGEGDADAFAEAFSRVYPQLQAMASARLRHEVPGQTLDTGALVHEAYLRLEGQSQAAWMNRDQFLAVAAIAMRRVVVDHARRRHATKRSGALVDLDALGDVGADDRDQLIVDVDEALERLAALEPRQARVVECRFFAGLTEEETAAALGTSTRTVKRDWAKARTWLYLELRGGAPA